MKKDKLVEKFDVAVIGGGPAGMIAAGRAAELGAQVVLIDKNQQLGKKLLMTGKGRCNITQANFDYKKLGRRGKFIYPSLSRFSVENVLKLFKNNGLETKVERGGRVFPVTDKAEDVIESLRKYLDKKNNVTYVRGDVVQEVVAKKGKIEKLVLNKRDIESDSYIIATGGKSYAVTGATGDGYTWAEQLGHKIIEPRPALTPIKTKEEMPKDLQGLSLKNVEVEVILNGKKKDSRFGEMIFTHYGVSGPIILDMSKTVGELLTKGKVELKIDLKPAMDETKLDERLQRDFQKYQNKDFKNALEDLLPQKMIPVIIELSEIDPDLKVHQIKREDRKRLVCMLKNLSLEVDSLMGFGQAIVTTGGVDLTEIDSATMKSKIVDNLYFAGEVIDLDGPTGGYNLQICWSTGYNAGESAMLALNKFEK